MTPSNDAVQELPVEQTLEEAGVAHMDLLTVELQR